jgi:vacuolar protein sorting-associated protein 1
VTRAELDKYKEGGSQALENALELENSPVFLGNIQDFDSARKKWLAHYKHECQRRAFPIGRSSNSECSDPGSEDENAVIDDFEDELVVMAEVHAYFEVAHKVSNRPAQLSTR